MAFSGKISRRLKTTAKGISIAVDQDIKQLSGGGNRWY